MSTTWSITPATGKQVAVRSALDNTVPLAVRSAVHDLQSQFGTTKQIALSTSGTLNADGTGTATITITAT